VRRQAELIVIGARRRVARGRTPIFGRTVDHVLKESPCRVLLAAGRKAA
jgi:nucleotide-binding universal stress UspA family protein